MNGKLLAYHTGKFTTVSFWQRGRLAERQVFPADGDGIARFGEHLGKYPDKPLHFLVDVIEEDFRLDTIPHLIGRSRAALVKRKLGQIFRTESYRHFEFQGRESEGHRNDRLLLTALTNDEGLKPWLDAALEKKALIAGIYSVPLLGQPLVAKLGLDDVPHLLLMTRQETGSLRQTYFQNGHLKFSRLTYSTAADVSGLADMVNEESAKIQQYLNNTRLLPRDQALAVHFMGTDEELRVLRDECNSPPLRSFELHDLSGAASALRLPHPGEPPSTESLFLGFLAQHRIANHYAGPRETRYWRLDRTALAMKSSGIALVIFGGLSAAFNVAQGLNQLTLASDTEKQAVQMEARTQSIRAAYPPLPASPDAMKQTVELERYLSTHPWTPESFMALLSRALEETPSIRIQRLHWVLTSNPDQCLAQKEQAAAPPAETPPTSTPGGALFEVAVVEGDVTPFTNFRQALGQVETLMARLKTHPGVTIVPVTLPIETSPKAQLKGSVSEENQTTSATFTLRITHRIESP